MAHGRHRQRLYALTADMGQVRNPSMISHTRLARRPARQLEPHHRCAV